MIEQAMIFALGSLTAGLCMLLLLPAVWRRALRLSSRRLAMQVPLSLDEIVAERDQLRAAFAIEQRKLEQKNETMALGRAGDMAELGRRAVRLTDLAGHVEAQRDDLRRQGEQLALTAQDLAHVSGENGALHLALFDEAGLRERRESELRGREDACQILQITSGQQQVMISDLETRLSVAEMGLAEHAGHLHQARRALAQRDEEIETLDGERNLARAQVMTLTHRRDGLLTELAALGAKAAGLEQALAAGRTEAGASTRELARRDEVIARFESQMEDFNIRAKAAQERSERALEQAYASERDMAQRLDVIRSEKAVANGALQAARDERGRLQRALAEMQAAAATSAGRLPARTVMAEQQTGQIWPAPADRAAGLRQAITDLADRLLRLEDVPEMPAGVADVPEVAVPAPPPRPQRLRGQPKKAVEKQIATVDPASA